MDLRALEPWDSDSRPLIGPDGRQWRVTEFTRQVPENGVLVTRCVLQFRSEQWHEVEAVIDRPLWSLGVRELAELLNDALGGKRPPSEL